METDNNPFSVPEGIEFDYSAPSKTAERLMLTKEAEIDPQIDLKARALDIWLHKYFGEDSALNENVFEDALSRNLDGMGVNLINELQKGNGMTLLDRLFGQFAIQHKMSSQSMSELAKKELGQLKIKALTKQIKSLL